MKDKMSFDKMKKVLLWGAGSEGKLFYKYLNKEEFELVAIIDNNSKLWGSKLEEFGNTIVISPDEVKQIDYDYICIATEFIDLIRRQCTELGLKKCISGRLNAFDYVNNAFLFVNESMIQILQKNIDEKIMRTVKENYWRNIFVDTVQGMEWYKVSSLSLGRWAIGYQYAYVLCRVLNTLKPESVLECGLGQSSKIINSYSEYFDNVKVDIIEHDKEWIDFWKLENECSKNLNIHLRILKEKNYYEDSCYGYDDFESVVNGKKYSLLSIDGPWGGDKLISRIDILSHLPQILDETFVILVDDYDRIGEKILVQQIIDKLNKSGIDAIRGIYAGEKDMAVIVPSKLSFLLTM